MSGPSRLFGSVLAAVALGAAACGGGAETSVGTTEKDFAITVDPASAKSGDVTFNITNSGPSTHEFVIFRTDLPPGEMPTKSDGTVDEEGEGVEHIDEKEDITADSTAELTVGLNPGNYVLICNLPGHYKLGMHTVFRVT